MNPEMSENTRKTCETCHGLGRITLFRTGLEYAAGHDLTCQVICPEPGCTRAEMARETDRAAAIYRDLSSRFLIKT